MEKDLDERLDKRRANQEMLSHTIVCSRRKNVANDYKASSLSGSGAGASCQGCALFVVPSRAITKRSVPIAVPISSSLNLNVQRNLVRSTPPIARPAPYRLPKNRQSRVTVEQYPKKSGHCSFRSSTTLVMAATSIVAFAST